MINWAAQTWGLCPPLPSARRGGKRSPPLVVLPTPGIWKRWKPTLHQTTSVTFRSLFLLLGLTKLFRNSLTHRSAVTGIWVYFFHERRNAAPERAVQPRHPHRTRNPCRNEITRWDEMLSTLPSLPTHASQPSSIQHRHASLCWVSKCPPVPQCTSPASSAQTLVAPHRAPAANRQLPSPTTPVLAHLESKSLAVGTSPSFLNPMAIYGAINMIWNKNNPRVGPEHGLRCALIHA